MRAVEPEGSGPHTTENADLPMSPERRNRYSSYAELENGASVGSSPHEVKKTSVQFGMTAAVVLAAGRATRMGRPKAFLPHFSPETTFLAHLVGSAQAAGLAPVLVVGRSADRDLKAEASRLGAVFVENPAPNEGQLSSLVAALTSFQEAPDAVVLLPVDIPLVTPGVIRELVAAAASSGAVIVRAAHDGQHGHPVLFKRSVFAELIDADPATGARAVVRADPARVLNVEAGEPGVLVDVDTPEDYRRVFGRPL